MKQKLISLMTAVTMIMSLFSAMPQGASAADTTPAIKLGDYVKMGTYVGSTLSWRCVAFEKVTGYDTNGNPIIDSTQTSQTYKDGYLPLMLADKAIGNPQAFDKPINDINNWGSNYWGDSDIRSLLKSFISGADSLWRFTDTEKAAMQTVTQKSLLAYADKDVSGASGSAVHTYNTSISNVVQNYSSAYSELITDTMFLLDIRQVYNVYNNLGDYYKLSSDYWLRSPYCSSSYSVRYITADGYVDALGCTTPGGYTPSGDMWYKTNVSGVRPAFFLDMSNLLENPFVGLDGSGTKDEPYTVVHRHVLTYHAKVDAMCTSLGRGEYWQCEGAEGCKKYFSDANGENEIFSPPYIYAKGHTWGEWVTTKEPTETEKGEKERECSVCHTKETKEVAAFNDLNIGDYLEMGEYDGTKLLWRCAAFEKATRQADGSIEIDSTDTQTKYTAVGKNEGDIGYLPLMLADTAIGKTKAFDAKGENTSGSHGTQSSDRTKYGSNYWCDSNIRDWLNSADKTVNYTCGNAPAYSDEAGFLTNFNSAEKAAMVEVTQKALINRSDFNAIEDTTIKSGSANHTVNSSITSVVQNYANAYSMQIKDTMFLLDVQQLYNAQKNSISWKLTDTGYWLRTPDCDTNYNERYVSMSSSSIDVGAGYAYSRQGVRPAFFFDLSSVEFEGGDGAKETPHTIPKPPHYHTLMHYEAVAPTCTASGNREYWKCEGDEGCNKMFSDEDCTTEITEIPTINAAGHKLTKTEAQTATCTQEGNRTYWTCSSCGKLFSDANGATETTLADTVIAAKGHSWGAWTVKTPATETAKGEEQRECSVCHTTETRDIPALSPGSTASPTAKPDESPSPDATAQPTATPGDSPSPGSTASPTAKPDESPSPDATAQPTATPGDSPSPDTTASPTAKPDESPSPDTTASPTANPEYAYSIKYEGGKAIVNVPLEGTYTVIFAAYDTNGTLTGVSVQTVTLAKGETAVEPQGFAADTTVKAMLWDSLAGMKPLCRADGN